MVTLVTQTCKVFESRDSQESGLHIVRVMATKWMKLAAENGTDAITFLESYRE